MRSVQQANFALKGSHGINFEELVDQFWPLSYIDVQATWSHHPAAEDTHALVILLSLYTLDHLLPRVLKVKSRVKQLVPVCIS